MPAPFRQEGLAQRLAPFVMAGTFGFFLIQGGGTAKLPSVATVGLALSLAVTASLFHPVWRRVPPRLATLPVLSCAGFSLLPFLTPSSSGVAGGLAVSAALAAAAVVPWSRLPRPVQAAPPLMALLGLLVLRESIGASPALAFPMVILIVLWLALHHSIWEVAGGVLLAAVVYLMPASGRGSAYDASQGPVYASVTILIGLTVSQLMARFRQQVADVQTVESVMRRIAAGDPDSARTAICEAAVDVGEATGSVLFEPGADGMLVPTAAAGGALPDLKLDLDGTAYSRDGQVLGPAPRLFAIIEAFRTRRPVHDTKLTGLVNRLSSTAVQSRTVSLLAQPVRENGTILGVLSLSWDRSIGRLSERTLSTVGLFAAEAAIVMKQADYLRQVTAVEQRLAQMAVADQLTGVANRGEFDRLATEPMPTRFAVLAVDIDNLKHLNDNYGHGAGDEALRTVARVMSSSVRDGDIVARTGDDEFAAILRGVDGEAAEAVAERMRSAMTGLEVAHGTAHISIGCATGGANTPVNDVWTLADDALYTAKQSGRDRVMLAGQIPRAAVMSRRRVAEAEVVRLLVTREIESVYQPIVRLDSRVTVGFEALARPQGAAATTSVDTIFAAAQRLGYERDLDWFCRRAAVQGAHDLPPGVPLFINVGVAALLDPLHDVDQMLLLLRWAKRDARDIVLEITEREAVQDMSRFEEVLATYRENGFRFAMDDVGEGHSTFEVLAASVPEYIKISARFAQHGTSQGPQSAVRAAVTFAQSTGAEVIAEGLEQKEVIEFITALGVTLGQGYGLGMPAPAGTFSRAALLPTETGKKAATGG